MRFQNAMIEAAELKSNTALRNARARQFDELVDGEHLGRYIEQLSTRDLKLHELRPGATKRTSSPGGPLMSRNDVRRSDISNPSTSKDTAKLTHRPCTVPPQSSGPSGSRRTKTVSVDDSDLTGVPSSSKWRPPAIAPEASSVASKDLDGVESTARKDAQAVKRAEKLYTSSETNNDTDAWFYDLQTYSHALLYDDVPKNPDRKLVRVAIILSKFFDGSGVATSPTRTSLVAILRTLITQRISMAPGAHRCSCRLPRMRSCILQML